MAAIVPSSLDSKALARRLGELVGDERNVQVEFLLHLDEFDRRRAFLDAGFGSLWDYCLRHLHLREGAAGRRIGAMRVLRRFRKLEAALRDGRLCLSTVCVLGPILTTERLDDLVARAAYRTKAEVEQLVASLQPRAAPKEGIRKIVAPLPAERDPVGRGADERREPVISTSTPALALSPAAPPVVIASASQGEPARTRPEIRSVSEEQWSLRVTIDSGLRQDFETLKALLSHKIPNGDLTAVLREALRDREARKAEGRRCSRACGPLESGTPNEPDDPGLRPAGGLEAGRGRVHLARRRRSALRKSVAGGDRSHSAGGARRNADRRRPPAALPPAQPAVRRTGLRARAHGSVQKGVAPARESGPLTPTEGAL